MLLKANLYIKNYSEAKRWGDSIMLSNEYTLVPKYADNFTLAGENGPESVFEIQYVEDPTSDYGEGDGFTRGTFSMILTRSRSSKLGGGWGFNKPTENLYKEFENGDPRRDVTILRPVNIHFSDESSYVQMETPSQEIYLGDSLLNRKNALYYDNYKTREGITYDSISWLRPLKTAPFPTVYISGLPPMNPAIWKYLIFTAVIGSNIR